MLVFLVIQLGMEVDVLFVKVVVIVVILVNLKLLFVSEIVLFDDFGVGVVELLKVLMLLFWNCNLFMVFIIFEFNFLEQLDVFIQYIVYRKIMFIIMVVGDFILDMVFIFLYYNYVLVF